VKPYVKRQKNDTTDAEAICEAVTRPNMRFVHSEIEQRLMRACMSAGGTFLTWVV
jgi:transposase